MKHPNQPVHLDEHDTARFKENKIVRFLLDAGPFDLNRLFVMVQLDRKFSENDWSQFMQLIGYSVSGFGDLRYADSDSVAWGDAEAEKLLAEKEPT